MNEFEIIEKYFLPLTNDYEGSLGLKDDAAVISPQTGYDLVVTKDAIVEDIHFFKNDDPHNIARKLLAVNISDLASMGAYPTSYLLAVILPTNIDEQWIAAFSSGLKQAVKQFGGNMKLIGGDTTSHDGPLTLTLTAMGEVPTGKALKRNGAKAGDLIYVSGPIGDSYLGLQILSGKLDMKSSYLTDRYYLPSPRVDIGLKIIGIANSCADISDGLVADLEHICQYSGVGAKVYLPDIPLSDDAKKSGVAIEDLITGGDDYELLFTAPADFKMPRGAIQIGEITANKEVRIVDEAGANIVIKNKGYRHF